METAEQTIAKRIREYRRRRRLTLQQISKQAGLSESFLSKIENFKVSISIGALSRVASAMGVPLGEFFDADQANPEVVYVPRGESRSITGARSRLPYLYEVLVPRRGIRFMQPVIITVDGRNRKRELDEHPGEQFMFVLEGELNYFCGDREYTLRAGDSLYFATRLLHGPKPTPKQRARYLAVFTTEPARPRRP